MRELFAHNQFNTSLSGEEAFSALLSAHSIPEIIKIIAKETSPPLWNVLQNFSFLTFGTSETVIRGLAFFFSLLTVFFVFKIGVLLWDRRTGLLAAALTFLNPFFFIYAFEGHLYSLLALGVTASMYFFLKKNFVAYVIATLGALYAHQFAVFAVVVQGIWIVYEVLTKQKERAIKRTKAFIIIGVLYLPWLYPLVVQSSKVTKLSEINKPTIFDFKNMIFDFLGQGIKSDTLIIPLTRYPYFEAALYLVFAVLILRRWHKSIKNSLFLLLWFIGPVILAWLFSQYITPIFISRYLLYSVPAAMLIVVSKGQKYSGYVVGVLLIVFGIIDFDYFTHPTKLPFKELAAYVQESRQPSDLLISANGTNHHLWETKYYDITAPVYTSLEDSTFAGTALMEENDTINEIPLELSRLGVIASTDELEISIPTEFGKTDQFEMGGLKLIWFERKQNSKVN